MSSSKTVPPFVDRFFSFVGEVGEHPAVHATDKADVRNDEDGDPVFGRMIAELETSSVPDSFRDILTEFGAHIATASAFRMTDPKGKESVGLSLTLKLPKAAELGEPVSTRPIRHSGNSPVITIDRATLEATGFRMGDELDFHSDGERLVLVRDDSEGLK